MLTLLSSFLYPYFVLVILFAHSFVPGKEGEGASNANVEVVPRFRPSPHFRPSPRFRPFPLSLPLAVEGAATTNGWGCGGGGGGGDD